MTKRFRHLLIGLIVLGIVSGLYGQPRPGSMAVSNADMQAAVYYWTAERRATAVARDMWVTAFPVSQRPPTPSGPAVSVPGALPTLSVPEAAEIGSTPASSGDPFWTQERRDQAIPRDMGVSVSSQQTEIPLGFTYPYPFTRYGVIPLLYWNNTVKKFPYTTVGKLFFTLSGVNYVCSASVLRPHLLLTARHCVYDYETSVWATNVIFDPGYYAAPNAALGGDWAAYTLATWVSGSEDLQYDIGMIVTYNKNRTGCAPAPGNLQIESYTGFLGYSYGGDYAQRAWDPFGYPAASPFSGKAMVQCETSTGALNQFGNTNTVEVGCDMTGGCSGGPWIKTFVPGVAGSNNYANGLNSFKFIDPDRKSAINSPQFLEDNFYNLLNFAMGLPCP